MMGYPCQIGQNGLAAAVDSRLAGNNRTVMGPHRKSRKRLEEYFEEDEFKPLEISSTLQSISIAKRNLNQAPQHLLSMMPIVSRTQALDETFERQTPTSSSFGNFRIIPS